MKIAAIDSSSLSASIAIMDDNKLICESYINIGLTHSQKLMPLVDDAFAAINLSPSDIDLYVGVTGPGSFTGLRIGISTIKGIAQGLGKPVFGVNSLDTLAVNGSGFAGLIVPIMDARRNQVYTATYTWENDKPKRLNDIKGIDIDELISKIAKSGKPALFTGDGLRLYADKLKEAGFMVTTPINSMQKASSAAYLASMANQSDYLTAEQLLPYYLRKPQAQRELEQRLGQK